MLAGGPLGNLLLLTQIRREKDDLGVQYRFKFGDGTDDAGAQDRRHYPAYLDSGDRIARSQVREDRCGGVLGFEGEYPGRVARPAGLR